MKLVYTKPALCSIGVDDQEIEFENDEVVIKLSSISNTLDPVSFYDALGN